MGLKELLPLKALIKEMLSVVSNESIREIKIKAEVFEDNQSAYYLATNQRITARTKHFLIKWHWFWEKYNNGEFTVEKCRTDEQLADWNTKPLTKEKFEANRKAIMGW